MSFRTRRRNACRDFFSIADDLSQFVEAKSRVVVALSTSLEGKENVLHNTRIAVSGSKIVAIDPKV